MRPTSLGRSLVGDLIYDGKNYAVDKKNTVEGKPEGYANKRDGDLFIKIPGLAEFHITELPSQYSVGRGKQGERGQNGSQGVTGKVTSQGSKGKQGKRGKRGRQGRDGLDGYRGYDGDQGDQGDVGEKGDKGSPGQIPYFIQSSDPGNIGAGGVWVKRMGIVEREDINVFAPRLMLTDLTMFRKEKRSHKVTVVTDGIPLDRIELKAEDDSLFEYSYDHVDADTIILTFENTKIPEEDEIWSTTVSLFVENVAGSTQKEFTLTLLKEELSNGN